MKLRTLREIPSNNLNEKKIIFRADFDVPVEGGEILDNFRIKAAVPTIKYLLERGGRILILTKRGHLDVANSKEWSTEILMPHLEQLIGQKISFLKDFPALSDFSASASKTKVFLFENLRFWPEEEANDISFAQKFAAVADIYVSDNFGTAHRAHSSVAELPKLLPSYAGFLLEKEVSALEKFTENPVKPVAAVLSGAKIETKMPLVKKFLEAGDYVLLGGVMANSALSAKGVKFGEQCVDKNFLGYIKYLDLNNPNLHLPLDGMASSGKESVGHLVKSSEVSSNECFFDAGPATVRSYMSILSTAKTILWNGPLGVVENPEYAKSTIEFARQVSQLNAFKVIGGGDLISFLERNDLLRGFDHISTGGGSMLEFLAGNKLPGIEVLKK